MTAATNRDVRAPRETAAALLVGADVALGALTAGSAGDHEVFASHEVELKAVYEHDDFAVSTSNEGAQFGIRTVADGRLGFVTTNADGEQALRAAAQEAQTLARVSAARACHRITPGPAVFEHEEVVDPELLALEPEALYAYLAHVVEVARRDGRVTLDRAEFTWTLTTDVIANSSGVRGSCVHASCSWMAMGMAQADGQVTSFDHDGSQVMRRKDLEAEIVRSMDAFRQSVIGSLGARAGSSYRGAVLLHPQVVMDLLGDVVESNCNGRMHVDGMSPWKDRLGDRVASSLLTVEEDPTDRERAEWSPFDREGVRTARHRLIENGRLAFLAYDGFGACRAGTEPTGNALGGPGDLPGVGFSNLCVRGDPARGRVVSEADLARELGSGLVVKRFSGNTDAQSGQFSGIAKNSWWVRGGERAHAVHEVMISGNVFDLLEGVVAAGDRLHPLMGAARAPYLLVDGVSVTGA